MNIPILLFLGFVALDNKLFTCQILLQQQLHARCCNMWKNSKIDMPAVTRYGCSAMIGQSLVEGGV